MAFDRDGVDKQTRCAALVGIALAACGGPDAPKRDQRSGEALAAPAPSTTNAFGATAAGASWVTATCDYKRASRFALGAAKATVDTLVAYVDGLGAAAGSQLVRGAIYAADGGGGMPGTLLCRSTDLTIAAGAAAGWTALPIAGTCALTADDYWLALQTGGPTEGLLRYSVRDLAGGLRHGGDAFSDGPSAPFGASGAADWQLAIYAAYTPEAAPTVAWSKPIDGQTVTGLLDEAAGNCEAVVTSSVPVDRVEFYLDGALLNVERYVPYSCIWDTSQASPGSVHSLRAVAYDTAGAQAAASVGVTVDPGAGLDTRCDQTIAPGESLSSFLARLGENQYGCLTAGTYDVGVQGGWKAGQKIRPAPASNDRYQSVTLLGNLSVNAAGVELRDLHVVGQESLASINGKVIEIGACDNCIFDHLEVTMNPPNAGLQGFLNYADTTGVQITNNRIHHVGHDDQFEHGIYCSHALHGGLIEGNWLYANAAFGIQFYPDCDGATFRHNVVDDNGYSITLAGEGSTHSDGVTVADCLLTNAHGGRYPASTIGCYDPGVGDQVSDVWATPATTDCPSSFFTNALQSGDPLYVNAAARDYRLRAGSPARAIMGAFADAIPGPRD